MVNADAGVQLAAHPGHREPGHHQERHQQTTGDGQRPPRHQVEAGHHGGRGGDQEQDSEEAGE